MDRLACVDLPVLPLQILLRSELQWKQHPVAVVENDTPRGKILYSNRIAREFKILPGLSYASGLSLHRQLRAACVPDEQVTLFVRELTQLLRDFSPYVEAALAPPGTFWLDASGLERLYVSLEHWGHALLEAIRKKDLHAHITIGFTKFGTYATARSRRLPLQVFDDPRHELTAAQQLPLTLLDLLPSQREVLYKLGIRQISDLIRLPASGLRHRFGDELWQLHRLAKGVGEEALTPTPERLPLKCKQLFDDGIDRCHHIVHVVEDLLPTLLRQASQWRESVKELLLDLTFDHAPPLRLEVRLAAPTLQPDQILGLLFLKLEGTPLPEAVIELEIELVTVPIETQQGTLFQSAPHRDLRAAEKALAQIRARFGENSVLRYVLREGHLPEAQQGAEPLQQLRPPTPRAIQLPPLIRRCFTTPVRLPPRARHEPDGWLLGEGTGGSVIRLSGPFVISGGWWNRLIHREYYFAETRSSAIYWLYYDRMRRRWFQQGFVS